MTAAVAHLLHHLLLLHHMLLLLLLLQLLLQLLLHQLLAIAAAPAVTVVRRYLIGLGTEGVLSLRLGAMHIGGVLGCCSIGLLGVVRVVRLLP